MSSEIMECVECGQAKDLTNFKQAVDGSYYPNCSDCFLVQWRADQLKFWEGKNTRRCGICLEAVPLSLYAKDAYGIPYKNCRACFAERSEREYFERKAIREAATANVAAGRKDDNAKPNNRLPFKKKVTANTKK